MKEGYSVVLTTAGTLEEAERIVHELLNKQLIACAQVHEIRSYYSWKGASMKEQERQLLLKCKTQHFEEIEACIKETHSYETPEIILIPLGDGSKEYFQRIDEVSL